MAAFFRFRSMAALLGDYKELEKQTIYFANPEELNDPMEGIREIVWSGDRIVWTNLFRHYISWLNNAILGIKIAGGVKELKLPILVGLRQLAPQGNDLFESIWNKFFSMPNIPEIITALAQSKCKITHKELEFYLRSIHTFSLNACFKSYFERGLVTEREASAWVDESTGAIHMSEMILKFIEAAEKIKTERDLDPFLSVFEQQYNTLKLIPKYGISPDSEGILEKNNELVLFDFPDVYAEALKELPWPKWWTACFTKSYQNLVMWAQYGNDHKGVCLIFDDNLNLEPNDHRMTNFRKVRYGSKPLDTDAFRSIGAGTVAEIMETWYTDQSGNRSECASHIGNKDTETDWNKNYWDNFLRTITTKTEDWRHEQEYRIILYDIFVNGVASEDGPLLTYNFNSLKGIIFGIKTSKDDKREIIEIIQRKCQENNRTDFKFFQAYYSPERGNICKYEMTVSRRSDEAKFYDNRGVTYHSKSEIDKAIEGYNKAIELNPDSAITYRNRGVAYYNKGKFHRAVDDFSKVISLTPDNPFAYLGRGQAYRSLLVFEKAIQDFSTAIGLKPDAAAGAYTERGVTYHNKGDVDKAIEDFNAAIALDPEFVEAYTYRGQAYHDKGEVDQAIEDYNEAIRRESEHAEPYTYRGIIYKEQGEIDKAIEDHGKAIELDPEFAEAYFNRGQAYYAKNELNKAIADYDKAIQLNPKLVEAYTHRGNAYRAKAELDSAIADYTEALKRRPKIAESYWTRGEAWLLAKEWEAAKTDLTAAILQEVDVAAAFQKTHGSIAAFEQKIEERLPKEIVALLTPLTGSFEIDQEARIALGMKYYGSGELSSGLASKLAGVPREEFWYLMGDYGLSPFGPDEEEYAKSGF